VSDPRASLYLAALLHDVGKAKGNKGHHKESARLIQEHGAPLGWNVADMERAAVVARFHCGALPLRSHKALRDLLPDEQKIIIQLAAILRLANAFDAAHDGHILRVKIENAATESPARNEWTTAPRIPAQACYVGEERSARDRRGRICGRESHSPNDRGGAISAGDGAEKAGNRSTRSCLSLVGHACNRLRASDETAQVLSFAHGSRVQRSVRLAWIRHPS
jgi:hypothetical protein